MVLQQLTAATHPSVIWQSHLLDITPTQWPSYKARLFPYFLPWVQHYLERPISAISGSAHEGPPLICLWTSSFA